MLIPKGNLDTRGIGLVEVVWKVVEAMLDTHIKSVVQSHDVSHGYCAGKGTRTAIMEFKLLQELASVDQDPLLLVFLELRKSYDNLERWRLIQTLEDYGEGPKLRGLLA